MDVGDVERTTGPCQVDGAEIVDFKGQLGITVQGGHGRVDDEIGLDSPQVGLDIFRCTNREFFGAGSPDIYFVNCFCLEVMGQRTADQS